jgi:hypothetical protein
MTGMPQRSGAEQTARSTDHPGYLFRPDGAARTAGIRSSNSYVRSQCLRAAVSLFLIVSLTE